VFASTATLTGFISAPSGITVDLSSGTEAKPVRVAVEANTTPITVKASSEQPTTFTMSGQPQADVTFEGGEAANTFQLDLAGLNPTDTLGDVTITLRNRDRAIDASDSNTLIFTGQTALGSLGTPTGLFSVA